MEGVKGQKKMEQRDRTDQKKTLDVQELWVSYRRRDTEPEKKTTADFPGDTGAVNGISFYVNQGEIVGIAGESGSGKSTAMLAVMGLLDRRAEVRAHYILAGGIRPVPGKNVAMIFQDALSCLNPTLTVGRQIAETVRSRRKCTRREARTRAEELLDMVGIRSPKLRMKQYPFELSGGMLQRVVIAVALACEPDLIIADEPTTALDAAVQAQILLLLRRIVKETGTSLLLVSHDLGAVAALCQRVYVMYQGKLIEEGTVEDVFQNPAREYTRHLLEAAGQKTCLVQDNGTEPPVIRAEKLTKVFDTREGVSEISLEIRTGEIFALVGESGSGKTTLARLLTGILKPDSGEIFFQGSRLDPRKRTKEQLQKIQMVFQDPYGSLNPGLTAGQALEEALRAGGVKDRQARRKKAEEMLCMTGLSPEDAGRYPSQFSGGQRQRIGIARALVLEPELLVCDEALSALDASVRVQILALLLDVWRRRKISCLFISHDMHLVGRLSSRIGVMFRGWLVEKGNTKDVCGDPWHPYTKQLMDAVPEPDPVKARRIKAPVFEDSLPEEKTRRKGCPFACRCGYAMECCREKMPEIYRFGSREVRCFLYSEQYSGKREAGYRMTSQI